MQSSLWLLHLESIGIQQNWGMVFEDLITRRVLETRFGVGWCWGVMRLLIHCKCGVIVDHCSLYVGNASARAWFLQDFYSWLFRTTALLLSSGVLARVLSDHLAEDQWTYAEL